jgi:hypothetical protein
MKTAGNTVGETVPSDLADVRAVMERVQMGDSARLV